MAAHEHTFECVYYAAQFSYYETPRMRCADWLSDFDETSAQHNQCRDLCSADSECISYAYSHLEQRCWRSSSCNAQRGVLVSAGPGTSLYTKPVGLNPSAEPLSCTQQLGRRSYTKATGVYSGCWEAQGVIDVAVSAVLSRRCYARSLLGPTVRASAIRW